MTERQPPPVKDDATAKAVTCLVQPCSVRVAFWSFAICGIAVLALGCQFQQPRPLGLPAKYTLENEHLVVQSDVKLPRNHELLKDLDLLRDEILATLDLPPQKHQVVV